MMQQRPLETMLSTLLYLQHLVELKPFTEPTAEAGAVYVCTYVCMYASTE